MVPLLSVIQFLSFISLAYLTSNASIVFFFSYNDDFRFIPRRDDISSTSYKFDANVNIGS